MVALFRHIAGGIRCVAPGFGGKVVQFQEWPTLRQRLLVTDDRFDLAQLRARQRQQVLPDGQVAHAGYFQAGVGIQQVQHSGNIARVGIFKRQNAAVSIAPLHGFHHLVPGGVRLCLGKGEQLTQRNVGPRALHPLVGGNILPNQNMLVRAGNRQRFFQKFAVIGLKFRVLHAGGILFQHKGFACRVKHLFAGARLVLCHLAHCLHTLFKQCGHLRVDLVNLRTGLLQLIHRQVPHIPWLFIFYYTIKRSVSQ